ncbi:nucleotidyltransferase domain-containing protein [Billgrantia azerbaijanica]|nr:nucleotidyltransferase domain-containing protein [Halomonas azerbaijanica]
MKCNDTGLDSDSVDAIRRVLGESPAVEAAILYGSRAKGTYRPGSDIDLTLIGDTLTHADLLDIELALDDLLLPWKIDLSLHHALANEALLEHIARVGVTLYRRHDDTPSAGSDGTR